jgi:hypothetical protein
MAESCLNFATRETDRLNIEIEVLTDRIRFHHETSDAWETIVRNAEGQPQAGYQDLANSERDRLNREIEAVQGEIHRHLQAKEAWETILRNAGSPARPYKGVTYMKSEDAQWHLRRLDLEIDALQREIHLHNDSKDAWETVLNCTGSELETDFLDLMNTETEQLNSKIEAVQDKIRRHQETRNAWDTILRNSGCEFHFYQGAMYLKGEDGQWHIQLERPSSPGKEDGFGWTNNSASKMNSVWQALLDACEKTFLGSPRRVDLPAHGKEQFQSLGLR